MILFFSGLLVSLAIIVYIVADAPHYDKSPWLWGIFAFFFGFLALGIYLYQTGRNAWGVFLIAVWAVLEFLSLAHGTLLL